MQNLYPYAQLIHIICAIIFVGYLFFDVVIFSRAKKKLDSDLAFKAQQAISSVAVKIMPPCVLLLILTGGMMMSSWVNLEIGYFNSPLKIIFMIKVILALLIFMAIVINLTHRFILKRPSPLGNIHPFAFIASAIIVVFAKVMFLV